MLISFLYIYIFNVVKGKKMPSLTRVIINKKLRKKETLTSNKIMKKS